MQWNVIAHGYGLVEGPTIAPEGSLLFSDVLGGGVHRVDAEGEIDTVVPKRRGVGGLALHVQGGVVCSGRDIVHVDTYGNTRTLCHRDGVAGWNDLCTDASGRVYAGSLRFAVFDPNAEAVPGELWRIDSEASAEVVLDGVVHANGCALSPDGNTVFLSDTRSRRLIIFDIGKGKRSDVDVSAYGHPDGMAIDDAGCVWLALVSGGIGRFTPDGTLDRRIDVPSSVTTSVCFDGNTLYATTGGHSEKPELAGCVLRTEVDATGAPVFPARI
jgi:gluconolactonase